MTKPSFKGVWKSDLMEYKLSPYIKVPVNSKELYKTFLHLFPSFHCNIDGCHICQHAKK